MKRKLLAALCVTAMSAGLLAGCGSSDKTEESTKTEETAKEETSSNGFPFLLKMILQRLR